ncbi:hypothetical protein PsYK624_003980 [Phanerochaete sordida]|uniref:Uncharacterized protein n=1 Tax=Phanerochaete sordida TaxID=48140 RepID=A0A9P3FWD8_9APHY|nr:hypothetical protein PsYK624_003980 [Phanerochaete sordida]
MFSSLLFPGLNRLAGAAPQLEPDVARPVSTGAASLVALHDAEIVNRSPVLRPSTTAENKLGFTASESVSSNTDAKQLKSPLINCTSHTDENLAPTAVEAGNNSTEEVFHTPLIAAGSDTSLKFKGGNVAASASIQSILEDPPSPTKESLQIRRGKIEPLGLPVPTTYADAANLANLHPEASEFILSAPITPKEPSEDEVAEQQAKVEETESSGNTEEVKGADRSHAEKQSGKSMKEPAELHSPSHPNWAVAPSPSPESIAKKNERRRRGSRQRGEAKSPESKGFQTRHRPSNTPGGPHRRPQRDLSDLDTRSPGSKGGAPEGQQSTPNRSERSTRNRGSPYSGVSKDRQRGTPQKFNTPAPVEDSPGSGSGTRSPLHLAQVDALIKELQKTRGLSETPSPSADRTTRRKKTDNQGPSSEAHAPSLSPAGTPGSVQAKIPWVWVAGHDGVLRPDMRMERPSAAPRVAPAAGSSAFVPAGMQDLPVVAPAFAAPAAFAVPVQAVMASLPSWAIIQPVPTPEQHPSGSAGPFPVTFDGASRGTVGRKDGRPRSRNPSAHSPARPEEEANNWRKSRLPKESGSKAVGPNPPSTAGPPISPVQPSHWPTLDEICAQNGPSAD